MAIINQSPSGQASVIVSGIAFTGLAASGSNPSRGPVIRLQDGGASLAISGINFIGLLVSSKNPSRRPVVRIQNGGNSVAVAGLDIISRVLAPQSLRGENSLAPLDSINGMLNLNDQIAIRRAETSIS